MEEGGTHGFSEAVRTCEQQRAVSRGLSTRIRLESLVRSHDFSSLVSPPSSIQKELAEVSLDPPMNCSAGPKEDNIYEWVSTISQEHTLQTQIASKQIDTQLAHTRGLVRVSSLFSGSRGLSLRWRHLLPGHQLPRGLSVQAAEGHVQN